MDEPKSILHELYVYSEWKPEPEYIQKPDGLLPENISALWRWFKFLGPKKSLIDSVTAHKERQQKWHIALGDEGKVIAVLTDNILEIRTKRSDYATIAARTTVSRDAYSQWRKLVWSPDCAFVVVAYGNGVVSFFDLTASNLFNIPIDCSRPGGLECTDNTHAVADIIFMPLRVKDTKWSWEVLIVNYDGKVRGFLVSQMDGFTLHHTNTFSGGISCVSYCEQHGTLYVAGVPRGSSKDQKSAHGAGITAWRILNDEPYYKLSVVSDQLEGQVNEKFQFYIPFFSTKYLAFIVQMVLSPDKSKLVCLHCNGDISVWRLPLLKLLHRFPLVTQPGHDLRNPLITEDKMLNKDNSEFYAADVNWWNNEEVILSRFSGAVSICSVEEMANILGARPEFLQGAPRVTRAHDGAFMALECETSVLPAHRTASDDSREVARAEEGESAAREALRRFLFALTDMEAFQPRPRPVSCVARVYRLLALRTTTPMQLFSRKIESGNYSEALKLAEQFNLDSDLVYQQQWRKNPVSTDAIQKYLSKVSKKIWAVHQCVDRLPETLPAAKELLQFGLELTNEKILDEINKDRPEDEQIEDPEKIVAEHLNAYTSELLRCRHVMLFYKERLWLYECILKFEKSTYAKDEYDRLRSNSIMRSSMEIAKEGRIEALSCLWPHIKTTAMKLAVLEKLPETINPIDYQHLLPTKTPMQYIEKNPSLDLPETQYEEDWCRKPIFRSIWSSNWSEETTPDSDANYEIADTPENIAKWYDKRAREIEERSGLASYALHLVTLATVGGGVEGLEHIMFQLLTLDTLIYDINVEHITLKDLEKMSLRDICKALMMMSTTDTFVSDLKGYVVPFLKRYEALKNHMDACQSGLIDYLESISHDELAPVKLPEYVKPFLKRYLLGKNKKELCFAGLCDYLESISEDDLAPILLLLQSDDYRLDVRTHLEIAERCLFAYNGTDHLDMACDLLNTILKESDGTISNAELVRRVGALERLVAGSSRLAWRGVRVPPRDLRDKRADPAHAAALLTRLARSLSAGGNKLVQADWEKLLKDILELQSTLFQCISKEQCYEIYASALLTSGDAASIKLAASVITCEPGAGRGHVVKYPRTVQLVLQAATEYFNSASDLVDPALKLAECCLMLIKDENPEIKQELDLLAALQILHSFNLTILPIQVRLCEDKMSLIESCLKSNPVAFLKGPKLQKLATLLRIAGDDEIAREAQVLQQVCRHAMVAGEGGCSAMVGAARRLAALHARGAALLLAHAAQHAHAHADVATRRALLAAALHSAPPHLMHEMLTARLRLEMESLEQMGANIQQNIDHHTERWPSTDDEFADAITTPVIERRDLVAPEYSESKIPLLNYLLDTFQNNFTSNSASSDDTKEASENKVHVMEFYRSLYPEHAVSDSYYSYDRFAAPDALTERPRGHAVLNWYYTQNCLADGFNGGMELQVVQKCAEEVMFADTALSVSMVARVCGDGALLRGTVQRRLGPVGAAAALYGALLAAAGARLRDNVYRAAPRTLAEQTLKEETGTAEQRETIGFVMEALAGVAAAADVRAHGFAVNGLLFHGDPLYRREIIYRVASSPEKEHLQLALRLGARYGEDALELWMTHAVAAAGRLHIVPDSLPPDAHQRIIDTVLTQTSGTNHDGLIAAFSILRSINERASITGLTATEHIKLLKKAKAASPDLDYKLLLSQTPVEQFSVNMLQIMKPENFGMISKLLRSLPPAIRIPISVNSLYAKWLTKNFFSVPHSQATNKKWMQQYRECASYFNKLTKDDLLLFIEGTCFSKLAIDRVPAGTRILMINQAVEYCQQEQENMKANKNEQSWAQAGQELARWARFLETFHSSSVQTIVENANVPKDEEIWLDIERSHGDAETVVGAAARLARLAVRGGALAALLQLLHVPAALDRVLQRLADDTPDDPLELERLVARLQQLAAEGAPVARGVAEAAAQRAAGVGLPPHRQVALLALAGRPPAARPAHRLLADHWPDHNHLYHEEALTSEENRRETFRQLAQVSDTLHQRKALVDLLSYWPPITEQGSVSLHCEYLQSLLHKPDEERESLVYIKMLLRRPLLTEQEIAHLAATTPAESVVNLMWIVLLNRNDSYKEVIVKIVNERQEVIKKLDIEITFIKELLENGMLIPLVPTVLYQNIVTYIVEQTPMAERPENVYDINWATTELINANYYAEAGNLYLIAAGTPLSLRGFSETVKFCTNRQLFHR